ncbi:hypothetical protein [Streptomyces hydrogenans]|uniref:hypothetical protein n=1 Tax=Streptomyces hydrogenans TaxID=1873719 RepID=UPI0037FBA407
MEALRTRWPTATQKAELVHGEGERVTIALDDRVTHEPDDDGDDQDGETGAHNGWEA